MQRVGKGKRGHECWIHNPACIRHIAMLVETCFTSCGIGLKNVQGGMNSNHENREVFATLLVDYFRKETTESLTRSFSGEGSEKATYLTPP